MVLDQVRDLSQKLFLLEIRINIGLYLPFTFTRVELIVGNKSISICYKKSTDMSLDVPSSTETQYLSRKRFKRGS